MYFKPSNILLAVAGNDNPMMQQSLFLDMVVTELDKNILTTSVKKEC